MNIRVTNLGLSDRMLSQLMTNQSNLLDLQIQMSTQKKLNKPSDNSVDAAQLLTLNKQQSQIDSYKTNISTAREQLNMLDSSLSKVIDSVTRANELTVEASNETYNADQLKGIKGEVDQIKAGIMDFANTQYNGQYIFSGNNTSYPAYVMAADGSVTYQGSNSALDSPRSIEIMDGVSIPLNVNGINIFGDYKAAVMSAGGISVQESGSGIFKALSDLSNALGASPPDLDGPTGIRAQLATIQDGLNTVNNVRTQYGSYSSKRIDMTESYLTDLSLSLSEQQSGLQDLDLVKAITDLNQQTYAYQGALQTTAQSSKLSLLDYI